MEMRVRAVRVRALLRAEHVLVGEYATTPAIAYKRRCQAETVRRRMIATTDIRVSGQVLLVYRDHARHDQRPFQRLRCVRWRRRRILLERLVDRPGKPCDSTKWHRRR